MKSVEQTFGNMGATAFENGRKALVQSTVAFALSFIEAGGWNGEIDVPKGNAQLKKKSLKALLRYQGADPATVDRHVNTACAMATKFSAYFSGILAERRTYVNDAALLQAVVASAVASGVNSVASLQRLVKTGNAALVQEADKTPEQIGQEAQDVAQIEADAIAEAVETGGLAELPNFDAAPERVKPEEVKPQIEGFQFLDGLKDNELAKLHAAIIAEINKRESEAKNEKAA